MKLALASLVASLAVGCAIPSLQGIAEGVAKVRVRNGD